VKKRAPHPTLTLSRTKKSTSEKGGALMHPARLAAKIQGQIEHFSGKLSAGLTKPAARMVREVLLGMQARGSVRLSEIGRALEEPTALKKVIERLGRHLRRREVREQVAGNLLELGSGKVGEKTLLVVDLTDISKPYARHMEHLARVRDGSTGEFTNGYWCCQVVGVEGDRADVMPLYQALYSQRAPDFVSENEEILKAIGAVWEATEGRGVVVIDRGGDRIELLRPWIKGGRDFVVRMRGDRHVESRRNRERVDTIAERCRPKYRTSIVREEGAREKVYHLAFGGTTVRLPNSRKPLSLMVVWGFGKRPLMLLSSLPRGSRKRAWQIVESYLARWRVEETIRFMKQSYDMEDIRLLSYERLRTMAVLVMAAAYFTCVYLGSRAKLRILTCHVYEAAQRIFGIADFRFYAIADGIRQALYGRSGASKAPKPPPPAPNLSLFPLGP